ncbi:E3 ubiquitin-protein ligase parkin-like [Oppia nitens]|uniref:E3 ubiquitin-protein ligase parkin-like n=1 Tax=Oppia nitens TaxID=1686743 RepID=UPI0023DA37FB|nr:E3 ubiquitin-protein ligase parkin-like [Oppia nitens]
MAFIELLFNAFNVYVDYILVTLRLRPSVVTNAYDNKMHLNIRYGKQNKTFGLNLTPDMCVEDIKRQLKDKIDVNLWSDIVIIFSGKELPNELKLSDCDFGQNSVIHAINAINIKTKTNLIPFTQSTINEKLTNLSINDTSDETRDELRERRLLSSVTSDDHNKDRHKYFFVFCNTCKQLTNGKLRVVCDKCKNGTIIVDRDPHEWDDVLIDGRIRGVCQSEDCNGSIARFYFKCASNSHNTTDDQTAYEAFESNRTAVLYLVRHNIIDVSCLACTDIKDTVLVFTCVSKHAICLDCFRDYCLSRLNDRRFITDPIVGYTLNCAVGCSDSLIRETHHFKLMGEQAYEKYQRFGAEEFVLNFGGVLCPQPGCGAGIMLDETDPDICTRITCGECGFVFCRKCLQGSHVDDCLIESDNSLYEPNTSSFKNMNTENADQSKWDEIMSRTAIKLSTKPCPKCRTPTERNGGCMHIVCTRAQCGFNWCWICQTEWNRDCMGNHWFG